MPAGRCSAFGCGFRLGRQMHHRMMKITAGPWTFSLRERVNERPYRISLIAHVKLLAGGWLLSRQEKRGNGKRGGQGETRPTRDSTEMETGRISGVITHKWRVVGSTPTTSRRLCSTALRTNSSACFEDKSRRMFDRFAVVPHLRPTSGLVTGFLPFCHSATSHRRSPPSHCPG